MEGIIVIVILVSVGVLVAWGLFCNEFYKIALEKGHDSPKYLWLPFFFSIAGILLVIALPDRRQQPQQTVVLPATAPAAQEEPLPKL